MLHRFLKEGYMELFFGLKLESLEQILAKFVSQELKLCQNWEKKRYSMLGQLSFFLLLLLLLLFLKDQLAN